MANDHYISRCLTRPWEESRRLLRCYDFDTRTTSPVHSKSFFALEGINKRSTEAFLNNNIEKPIATSQRAVADAVSMQEVQAVLNAGIYRAYAALFWLQSLRTRDARAVAAHQPGRDLDALADKGAAFLDALVAAMYQRYELVFGLVNPGARLYFPETGLFAMPAGLQRPLLCMPLTTVIYIAFRDRAGDTGAYDDAMKAPNLAMCASVGLDNVRKILLPPDIAEPPPGALEQTRTIVRDGLQAYGELALGLGLEAWGPNRGPAAVQ